MPSIHSVARSLLVVLGVGLMGFGVLTGASAWGSEGFPAGLALGFALLVFAAGGAVLGGAALLSGHSLRPAQRAGVKLAGVLAVAAFVVPAAGLSVAPELLTDWYGAEPLVGALVAWLYLSTGAFAVGTGVALWRAAELAYASFTQ